MTDRERVVNFLSKVNWEGFDYYFHDYVSPATIKRNLEGALSEEVLSGLEQDILNYLEARSNLEETLSSIRKLFKIKLKEIEC